MEEVGPDNEIGLDDVNGGNVVDALDGGYTINDYVYCRKAIYVHIIYCICSFECFEATM